MANEVATAEPQGLDLQQFTNEMIALARDPKVDADKMRVMYDLQRDVVADRRKELFNQAKMAAMFDMPSITKDGAIRGKDKANGQPGDIRSRYSTFKQLYATVKPILKQHGLVMDWEIEEPEGESKVPMLKVRSVLRHTGGHVEISGAMPIPIVAANSTVTLAQGAKGSVETGKRVTLIASLGIIEEENPQDHQVIEEETDEQKELIRTARLEAAKGMAEYQAWWKSAKPADKQWLMNNKAEGAQHTYHDSNKKAAEAADG